MTSKLAMRIRTLRKVCGERMARGISKKMVTGTGGGTTVNGTLDGAGSTERRSSHGNWFEVQHGRV